MLSHPIRILIVDDHPFFRAGLAITLRGEPQFEVVAEADDAAEAIVIARSIQFDVAIVDVLMPVKSGVSLAGELRELQPSCRILGLSGVPEATLIADMLLAGANGFALKTQPKTEIVDAVCSVMRGARYLPPGIPLAAIERELASTTARPLTALTRREREVFELVIRGHSNDAIATRLSIARRTVETHRQRASGKLSAHSLVEMIRVNSLHGGLT